LSSLADEKRVGSLLRSTPGARSGASDDDGGGSKGAMREQVTKRPWG
jgi:hypothetical protein